MKEAVNRAKKKTKIGLLSGSQLQSHQTVIPSSKFLAIVVWSATEGGHLRKVRNIGTEIKDGRSLKDVNPAETYALLQERCP